MRIWVLNMAAPGKGKTSQEVTRENVRNIVQGEMGKVKGVEGVSHAVLNPNRGSQRED